ncbi:helix-turn-helix transcriptional regulator [Geobacter sp.]|uniref:helix-turn-helix transcriptional regulator n=1 Tax=Geobacter sp. TaxID=46610 RepID=UPI001ACF4234|nr:hypothetical protein ANRL1_00731 [Anaerolineae bacterium]
MSNKCLQHTPNSSDRLLSFSELKELIPLSRSTIWRLEKSQRFPRRRQISPKKVGWLLSEVLTFINSRKPADEQSKA